MADKTVKTKILVAFDEADSNAPLQSGSSINELFGQTKKNLADLKDAEKNTIVGIQKNGTDIPIDVSRKVNITVPTKVSELTDGVIEVDEYGDTYVNGSSMYFSTSSRDLFKFEGQAIDFVNEGGIPKINGVDIATKNDIPTKTSELTNDAGFKTTDTTYSNMTAATASTAGKAGLVPAPAAGKQTSFLKGDGTWAIPTNTTYSDFVKSGSGAKAGLVPAPPTTAGTSKYLREDGTWATPPESSSSNEYNPLEYVESDDSVILYAEEMYFSTSSPNKFKMEGVNFTSTPQINGVDITIPTDATTSKSGLMSAADKTAINNLASTYVSAKSAQSFTDTEKQQARTNIGAFNPDTDLISELKCKDDYLKINTRTLFFSTSGGGALKLSGAVNFLDGVSKNGSSLASMSDLTKAAPDGFRFVVNTNSTSGSNYSGNRSNPGSDPYVSLWYSNTKIAVMRFYSHTCWVDDSGIMNIV